MSTASKEIKPDRDRCRLQIVISINLQRLTGRRTRYPKTGALVYGEQGCADHSEVRVEDSFPFELLPAFKDLNLGGLGIQGYGCRGGSASFSQVLLQWKWHALTFRLRHFSASTLASPCFPYISQVQKNRNRSGSPLWHAWKKLGALA